MLKEVRSTRLVKGADLNHHGTLFAGRMADWFTESCFLAALRLIGSPEAIVCVQIHGLTFRKPAHPGDSVEIVSVPVRTGTTSVTIGADVFVNDDPKPTIRGFATFVTVDPEGRPFPHGITLPPGWLEEHADICESAKALGQ